MKRIVSLFLVAIMLLMPFGVNAIEIGIATYNYGGTASESFEDVVATSDGGWVAVGYSSSEIENLENKGSKDAIIAKYDKNGHVEWQDDYGGDKDDVFKDVVVASDGGYVVVGYSSSSNIAVSNSEEDKNLSNNGGVDVILVKYDSNGNIEWQQDYGGDNDDSAYAIVTADDGGYVVVGNTKTTNIDDTLVNNGASDAMIVKYDENGDVTWKKNYGGTSNETFYDVDKDSDGGYIAVGYSESSTIGDLEMTSTRDAVIVKYDKDGSVVWQHDYSGNVLDSFNKVKATSDGGYIAVGFSSSTDLDGITNQGDADGIIVKYDKNGKVEWAQDYGGTKSDYFYGVVQDSDGGYIVVGYSSSSIEGITNQGNVDGIIAKYDEDGNLTWQRDYGGTSSDYFYDIAIIGNNTYVVVGSSSSSFEEITNKGSSDSIVIILKYQYEITNEDTSNGTFSTSQENNVGKIIVSPDSGYEIDKIIITDTSGNSVSYYEEDGYYYFNLTDDVVVSVSFKEEIINPSTFDNISIYVIALASSLIVIFTLWHLVKEEI